MNTERAAARWATTGACGLLTLVVTGCGGGSAGQPGSTSAPATSTTVSSVSSTPVTASSTHHSGDGSSSRSAVASAHRPTVRTSAPTTSAITSTSAPTTATLATTATTSVVQTSKQSNCATYPGGSGLTIDPCIRRDKNGFALGGPTYPKSPADYTHPTPTECSLFRTQLRAWSDFQNAHRPPGATNGLPFSADVQYLFTVCHLDYY